MSERPPAARGDMVSRSIRWMPYVLLAGLLGGLVRWVSPAVSNPDTFFHLRFGHEFLSGDWSLWNPGHVTDFGQRDWVPTQWASQMLMAAFESVFGLPGVVWLSGTAVLVTVTAVFVIARRYADPLPSVLVTILAVLAISVNLTGRPQVASYLLILVITHAWLRTAQDLRPRWWLIAATWAWASLHGMWPIGAVIGLVVVLGIALDNRDRLGELRPVLLRLLAVPLLSLVAAGLTPVGPRLYGAVLLVGGRAKFHDEWSPTDFHEREPAVVAVVIVLILVIWLRGRRPDWVHLLLLLLAAGWSAYAFRTVPVAVMITVPLFAAALQSLLGTSRPGPRRERTVVGSLLLTAVVLLAVVVPVTADRAARVPSWVDPALDRLPAGTAILDSGSFGGYLMWRHPELAPTSDGYTDAYTTKYLQDQLDIVELRRGWDVLLRTYGARYALLPTRAKLAYALVRFEDWKVLHASEGLTLLEAPEGWGG